MKKYNITGMSCAACSSRIERAVSAVEGVSSCSVSLLTNSMSVEGDAASEAVITAVKSAGYGASLKSSEKKSSELHSDELKDNETPVLKRRLIWSLIFLIPLMYISMGNMMWNFPLPGIIEKNHVTMAIIQLLLTTAVMVINQKFFISGFKGLIHRSPNMDSLVAIGSGASYIYSIYALFAMSDAQFNDNHQAVMSYMHELYFESAAMILTLITVGKLLEARSKGKTTDALKGLMKLAPKKAVILRNGTETEVSADEVSTGDIFVVRPGENIPVDGIVIEGNSAVNESALTGESVPVDKSAGDTVSAASINTSGFIRCRATKVGEDTTLSQIIKMVSDAAATKAPIAKTADKVSGIFVPAVIAIAVITVIVWLLAGQSFIFSLERGISVLVISCPCALGLATPVSIMVGSGMGAKNGILFKTAESLENTGKTEIAVLDKTGTVTLGKPEVTNIIPAEGIPEEILLSDAYSLECKSEHPLAGAVVRAAQQRNITAQEIKDFRTLTGSGLSGFIGEEIIYGGNQKFISEKTDIPGYALKIAEEAALKGETPMFFCKNGVFTGIITVADTIKEESPQAVAELKNMGIRVVMLTGDNENTANAVGKAAGVDEIIAGVLPEGKENVIRKLKKQGRVAMVGDGINDAPALTRADTGIAIGAGTDIAIDAADVILVKSRLTDVPAAIRISRAALKNIHENLFWAFIYNIIGIPLAAGIWFPVFGWKLNPMFGAAAMSLSSFCVVSNALRLNLLKVRNPERDRKIKHKKIKEDKSMEVTLKIEGMMCGHCEASVKKALEAIPTVSEAVVSHESGTAVVSLTAETPFEVLKKAVEDKDYTVIG
ncbi:MAG: heavy metal translocating P-type ATPase [Ruminococcus sp.]